MRSASGSVLSSAIRSSFVSCLQEKFDAMFVLPEPLYTSLSGYLQIGLLTVASAGLGLLKATIESGATPCSTQLTSALNRSVLLISGAFGMVVLPAQWPFPAYGKNR